MRISNNLDQAETAFSASSWWWRWPCVRALAALLLVMVLGLIFNADGAFLKWGTHRDMLRHVSVYGILACGMTLVCTAAGLPPRMRAAKPRRIE